MKQEFESIEIDQCLSVFILSLLMISAFSFVPASASQNLDDFPVGLILEYEKEYKHMRGPIDDTFTVRYEVLSRVEDFDSRFVIVRTITDNNEITNETFYQDYPNGSLTVHELAPLWINLSSLENVDKVMFGWRVYNITSYDTTGCSLHHEEGYDEDTIGYDSHGIFASGYFFHFNIDDPFGTNSLSTKLVRSNLNPVPPSSPYGWLLTAILLPVIALEIVIIASLIKKRRVQSSLVLQ